MSFNGTVARGTAVFSSGKFSNAMGGAVYAIGTPDLPFSSNGTDGGNLSTGTAECWVKIGASDGVFLSHFNWWYIQTYGQVVTFGVGQGNSVAFQSATRLNDGLFHHVALVIASGLVMCYVDGVQIGISSVQCSTGAGSVSAIGGLASTGTAIFSGMVDEVRFSSNARYSGSSFTVPSAAFADDVNTLALYHLETDATDSHVASTVLASTIAPVITPNTATIGTVLTSTTGSWAPTPDSYAYQWNRSGAAINGAVNSSYTVATNDVSATITCLVTTSKASYTNGTATSNAVLPAGTAFTTTGTPVISGTTTVGQTLTSTTGSWAPTPDSYVYQWNRSGAAINGATGTSYISSTADGGNAISVTVTALKANYASTPATSAATSVIAAAPTTTFLPNDAGISYSPFNWDVTSLRAGSINPGAYFSCTLNNASAISLNFDMSNVTSPMPRIKIRVDDGPYIAYDLSASVALTIPTTNGWVVHTVDVVVSATSELVNRWNPQNAIIKFTGLTVVGTNTSLRAAVKAPVTVLVYGDSITEGYKSVKNVATPDGSDSEVTWAYLLRHLLGVEVGVVGFGAQGWVNGGQGGVPNLPSSYNLQWFGVSRSLSAPVPDLIIINMGQNDSADTTSLATSFLNTLLSATPATTKIGLMRPFSGAGALYMSAAAANCATPSRVTYIDTTGWYALGGTDVPFDGIHPAGFASQQSLGPKLANALRAAGLVNGAMAVTPKRWLNVGGIAKAIQ